MNVLLVDDNRFVIQALTQKIDWKSLGVERVLSASNIVQAQEIFQTFPVDLLICDIEMPGGSGLELLSWIRGKGINTPAIFLTSYADFNYAQKAIELQSFDYFLKPIAFDKLTVIIQKALDNIKEDRKKNLELAEKEMLWHESQKQLREVYWYKVITGKIFPSANALAKAAQDHHVPYTEKDYFLPVLIQILFTAGYKRIEDRAGFENDFMELITEVCVTADYLLEIALSCMPDDTWVAVFKMPSTDEKPDKVLSMQGELIRCARERFSVDICCSIGKICPMQMIHQIYMQLLDMNFNTLQHPKNLLFLSDYNCKSVHYIPPNLELIDSLLKQLDADALRFEIAHYMQQMKQQGDLTTHVLQLMKMDITQLIYSFLKSNGVPAHKLMLEPNHSLTSGSPQNLTDNATAYINSLIDATIQLYRSMGTTKSITDKITSYIEDHYADDLSRNRIAELFYLNPDYLSRLFTREKGVSLINYITQIRISRAKKLLRDTDEPIHSIASKVGYGNYSHFSKIFKECCGFSPKEYRNKPNLFK